MRMKESLVLGLSIIVGLSSLGYLLGESIVRFKSFERSVTVKGLSEREYPADIALWPITFTRADNDLAALYESMEKDKKEIVAFLENAGFERNEITINGPAITDKLAQEYGGEQRVKFRYVARQSITVYTPRVKKVRESMQALTQLGKKGIVFERNEYGNRTEYLFTKLNSVKPEMIEEATRNARKVAQKFAKDSQSRLGKIKKARQGQFSITNRDKNTPYIKKVRVVSTIEYYLAD
ncbi:SIMPL domain-containing protein [Hydrogenimonas urashimensis]|uniref:SIMPL domain-containing protein n=1 Tax=Hydrogenimonas urashimensis TaxID=2740515 RepID=UPI001916A2F4|nr:SIMPL domain-containing protein [Hydrogenimonas urashimensis]